MKSRVTAIACSLFAFALPATAEESAANDSDWHFAVSASYSSRSLDGTIVDRTQTGRSTFGTLFATGDSMDVGTSEDVMLAMAVQYKRFGFGFNYMPTSYHGTGFALVEADANNVGVITSTPLQTDIDVTMMLANAYYNLIQTADSAFGFGVGLGRTNIDLSIVPDVGESIIYDGNQPFGFLNIHFYNFYEQYRYGFSLNGISGSFDGVGVSYSDYKVELGYRIGDGNVKYDIIGGYRMVNFAADLEDGGVRIATDITLKGPFIGVTVIF